MAKLYVWGLSMGHPDSSAYGGWSYSVNSAGGCSFKLSFMNNTGKTIKYAHFWAIPYNAVEDAVKCTIKKKSLNGGCCTGPVENGKWKTDVYWENMWYNNSIKKVVLSHVYLEYMDGTEERVEVSDISFSVPEVVQAAQRSAQQSSGGCYVATAVYGSYDCPEVWTLRRYRDNILAKTWCGRAFIRTYYAISPTLVKWFGHTEWFKKMWQGKLDCMVAKLQSEGVESTPYEDKNW